MLAHGETCLATANNERIYLFNWRIPVHFWLSKMLSGRRFPVRRTMPWMKSPQVSSMDLPIFTARFVAGSDARPGSSQTGIK